MSVKDPEKVRADLLSSALRLGAKVGLPSISVDAVAKGAGVTKGALFHHFPSKRMLVEAVFARMLEMLSQDLASIMSSDPEPFGRFTRAYLRISLRDSCAQVDAKLWRSCVADAGLSALWEEWLQRQLHQLHPYETDLNLEAVRLAADGLWLGVTTGHKLRDPTGLSELLIALTSPPTSAQFLE